MGILLEAAFGGGGTEIVASDAQLGRGDSSCLDDGSREEGDVCLGDEEVRSESKGLENVMCSRHFLSE